MILVGKTFSHYRILQLIGKGGMGEVYLVEDIRVQRQVAAKFIRMEMMQSNQGSSANALRLFWREATAIAQLDHPTILPLYDHGEAVIDDESVAYLIMPYRPEGSLTSWLHQTQQLSLQQIAHVILHASQSLQYAHDHQIMHLDVKPANFLIRGKSATDAYPDLLLSDFGIARLVNATSNSSQQVRGTPTYMAPEQWASKPMFASDQYALAIMAYELLTGNPPFQGAPMNVMFAHLQEYPSLVSERYPLVPSSVDSVLQRALAKKPEERFPSISEFARAFQETFQGLDASTSLGAHPSSATPPQTPGSPVSTGDIRATLAISVEEARLGTTRRLTLPAGQAVSVQIPPDARAGQVLVLLGQGEKLNPNTPAGNLYLTIAIIEAPLQVSPPNGDVAPTARRSLPIQTPSPIQVVAPVQEKNETLPPLGLSGSTPSSPQIPVTLPVSTYTRPPLPHRYTRAFPLPSARPKRRRLSPVIVVLLLLVLILIIGGASFGIYRAVAAGNIWTIQTSGTSQNLSAITWSGSQFVVVGGAGTILTSPDGRTWTDHTSIISHNLSAITWSGSQFVAVGDGGTILTSPDGRTWTDHTSDISHNLSAITWSGSQFVAVGGAGTVLTSPDGRTWTHHTSGTSQDFSAIAWSGSQFAAGGSLGTVLTSPDGRTWTDQGNLAQSLVSITWSGSQFVAGGGSGSISTSPDGHTWTLQTSDTSESVYGENVYGIAWSGPQFVAVGDSGSISTSPDGHTWTDHTSASITQSLYGIVWSGSRFVAVGNDGTILTSP